QSVAGGDHVLGGSWTSAVHEVATFGAAGLWGFALWWIATAAVITRHAGRAALTYTAADWGFVFPSAAMVIATLTLGRWWQSGLVEVIGFGLGVRRGVSNVSFELMPGRPVWTRSCRTNFRAWSARPSPRAAPCSCPRTNWTRSSG
ncbi:MAG TPA: hypothetical protein VIJ00_19510, partial [Nakamurella sp.]